MNKNLLMKFTSPLKDKKDYLFKHKAKTVLEPWGSVKIATGSKFSSTFTVALQLTISSFLPQKNQSMKYLNFEDVDL